MDRRQDDERPWPFHSSFNAAAYPLIAHGQNQEQQQNANQSARTAFPNQSDTQEQEGGVKKCIPADERHDPIEKGVNERRIDESKQLDIQCLQPRHGAKSKV